MRLTPFEKESIINSLKKEIGPNLFELYLFGSRTDGQKKGGDIDLLILAQDLAQIPPKHRLILAITKVIGEQKIDLVIEQKSAAGQNPFVAHIFPQCLRLY